MKADDGTVILERTDDAFLARWVRRLAPYLVPLCLTLVGYMWNDRRDRVSRLNVAVGSISSINLRIDSLQRQVDEWKEQESLDQEEIKAMISKTDVEIGKLRDEVREMYRRAIAAGGKSP